MIELRPLSSRWIGPLARDMRRWDRVECAAAGLTPKAALRLAMRSGSAWVVVFRGTVVGAVGVHALSLAEGRGCVWGLFTRRAMRHARAFITEGPKIIEALTRDFIVVENVVCADNRAAIRWLRHMGFDVSKERQRNDGYRFREVRLCVHPQL